MRRDGLCRGFCTTLSALIDCFFSETKEGFYQSKAAHIRSRVDASLTPHYPRSSKNVAWLQRNLEQPTNQVFCLTPLLPPPSLSLSHAKMHNLGLHRAVALTGNWRWDFSFLISVDKPVRSSLRQLALTWNIGVCWPHTTTNHHQLTSLRSEHVRRF